VSLDIELTFNSSFRFKDTTLISAKSLLITIKEDSEEVNITNWVEILGNFKEYNDDYDFESPLKKKGANDLEQKVE